MELTEQEVAKIVEEASSTRLPMLVSLTEEHELTVNTLARRVGKSVSWVLKQAKELEEQGVLKSRIDPMNTSRGRVYSLMIDRSIVESLPHYERAVKLLKPESHEQSAHSLTEQATGQIGVDMLAQEFEQQQEVPRQLLTNMQLEESDRLEKSIFEVKGLLPGSLTLVKEGERWKIQGFRLIGRAIIAEGEQHFIELVQESSKLGILVPIVPIRIESSGDE